MSDCFIALFSLSFCHRSVRKGVFACLLFFLESWRTSPVGRSLHFLWGFHDDVMLMLFPGPARHPLQGLVVRHAVIRMDLRHEEDP